MKAEIAVRSISASISACVALMAPRMISSVTGSQALPPGEATASPPDSASLSVERSIGRVLDDDEGRGADHGSDDHEGCRRDRAPGLLDQEGRDEGREAPEYRDREAIADRERREAHLGGEELAQYGAKRPRIHGEQHGGDALREYETRPVLHAGDQHEERVGD